MGGVKRGGERDEEGTLSSSLVTENTNSVLREERGGVMLTVISTNHIKLSPPGGAVLQQLYGEEFIFFQR